MRMLFRNLPLLIAATTAGVLLHGRGTTRIDCGWRSGQAEEVLAISFRPVPDAEDAHDVVFEME
jgi:hypothetical protein